MTRPLRRWHAYLWLALAPLIVIGLLSALSARPPVPIQSKNHSAAERGSAGVASAPSPVAEAGP